ncbi:MAG: type I secretion system permease/ATPase, partial [Curvibacter sp.]
VYGQPRLVVLDEPNASLDAEGDRVLLELLGTLKQRGVTVVVITHRSHLLTLADRMLLLVEGTVQAWGTPEEVMAKINAAPRPGTLPPDDGPVAPAPAYGSARGQS